MPELPWTTITVATGGWTLFGLVCWAVMRALISGDLATKPQIEGKDETIAAQRSQLDEQGKQLTLLLKETMPTTNAVLRALHEAAEDTK